VKEATSSKMVKNNVARRPNPPPQNPPKEMLREKRVESVPYSEGIRCGMRAFQGEVAANVNGALIGNLAEALVGQVNDATGLVPQTGGSFCYGYVLLYLYQAILAYQARAGVLSGDVSEVVKFQKYVVPGWFAVLLTHLAPWDDRKSGARVVLESSLTYSTVAAISPNEGSASCPVITGNSATLGNEPTFGPGLPLTLAGAPAKAWSDISDILHSALPCVAIAELAKVAPSCQGIVAGTGGGDAFYTLKPQPPCVSTLSLFTVSDRIGPHASRSVPVRVAQQTLNGNSIVTCAWLYAHYGRKFVYDPVKESIKKNATRVSSIWSRGIPNLWEFNIVTHPVNFSKFSLEVLAWCRRTNILSAYTSADLSVFNTLQAYWWAMILSKSPFLCRFLGAGTYASYSNKAAKTANAIPNLGFQVYKPSRIKSCVYLPTFDKSVSTLTWFQSGNSYVKGYTDQIGIIPVDTSTPIPAGVTLGFLSTPLLGTLFNTIHLTLTEELERYLGNVNAFANQTIPLPSEAKHCPCDVAYAVGTNIDAVGNFVITYYTSSAMSCGRPVSGLECMKEMCGGLQCLPEIELWYSVVLNANQNMVNTGIDAGYYSNNMSIFGASSSKGNPIAAVLNLYDSNLRAQLKERVVDVTGSTLIKMAKEFLAEGGEPNESVPEGWLRGLENGIRDLTPTVASIAGALGSLTVAGRAALSAYRRVRLRVDEL
jgi:hypothetical protein